ncbi:PmeII family type II restriction endonuclease [Lactobacillus sp. IBH004]|uniref:PmeII family type II restriction endonuclease n=1 Tax=Lactobacillus sp. IBH004 TaxID=2879107 RepID=UPI00224375A5|nr:PmeII family type II restriction endonuclease [Lactobacillus sp. IBH004]UZN42294.1 PmeII family type II restriction endonuclease [Lactobacillus sp. IBH004]
MTNNNFTKAQLDTLLDNTYKFFLDFFADKAQKYEKREFNKFDPNPFTIQAAATGFSETIDAESMAKAIVYPFALGTSLSTSFGTKFQEFIVDKVQNNNIRGSLITGMDIEYIDAIDGRQKYCQVKSGPNTINKDDIKTIEDHIIDIRNLANTNHMKVNTNDVVIGILYGNDKKMSNMYKRIKADGYTVLIGNDFWYHLTGSKKIYEDLIEKAQDAAKQANFMPSIKKLVKTVQKGILENKDTFGL